MYVCMQKTGPRGVWSGNTTNRKNVKSRSDSSTRVGTTPKQPLTVAGLQRSRRSWLLGLTGSSKVYLNLTLLSRIQHELLWHGLGFWVRLWGAAERNRLRVSRGFALVGSDSAMQARRKGLERLQNRRKPKTLTNGPQGCSSTQSWAGLLWPWEQRHKRQGRFGGGENILSGSHRMTKLPRQKRLWSHVLASSMGGSSVSCASFSELSLPDRLSCTCPGHATVPGKVGERDILCMVARDSAELLLGGLVLRLACGIWICWIPLLHNGHHESNAMPTATRDVLLPGQLFGCSCSLLCKRQRQWARHGELCIIQSWTHNPPICTCRTCRVRETNEWLGHRRTTRRLNKNC